MLKVAVFAIALVLPGVALAQTTTCQQSVYGMPQFGVTCETDAPKAPVDPASVPAKRCTFSDRFVTDDATCQARAVAADRKAVTDKIAAGDCAGAQKSALALGDLQFAREVRDYCSR